MKNKQQVSDFLARVRCRDEQAESQIRKFLKQNNTRAKFSRNRNSPVIDYESFIGWYNSKVPRRGELIVLESGLAGVFHDISHQDFTLNISYDGTDLNLLPVRVPVCKYRSLKKDELLKLQHVFSGKGIAWSNTKGIVRRLELQDNIYYRISRLGVILGAGVFREINDKGEVVFYCVKMEGKPVRFSLYEVIGKERDFQFELMNNKDRETFMKELRAVNRYYNGYLRRIEPLYLRAERHHRYYYINDIWEIAGTEDKYKPKDLRRFNRGNYFRTYEDAQAVLSTLEEKRSRQLIHFEGNLKEGYVDNLEDAHPKTG